jgi:hypothetical protein
MHILSWHIAEVTVWTIAALKRQNIVSKYAASTLFVPQLYDSNVQALM